ncbi:MULTISPECIES: excisionase [Lactobacillus]|uniref:Transposase n=1 Tax=Lactobacillus xujianguonis TaxID=2495899 RepID=A0A437SUW2_9LACO|nr:MULTISPECIES: excisionase [Lactobacillus]RVU70721.1 transposase [Lactobacillus xujianguonis]
MTKESVPIWHKTNLTIEEAAAYSNIGLHKLREITDDEDCNFVLWVGNKRLIKRVLFDKYLKDTYSI